MTVLQDRITSMVHAFGDHERKDAVRALARDVGAMEARIAELEKMHAPICVGRPIIEMLASDGQWLSEDGRGLIAASCLFKKNPYDDVRAMEARIVELEARCKRLEEAGDHMADWNMNERNLGCDPELADAWQQAKEAKPCPHCLRVECECSEFDACHDMGDK